MNAPGGAVRDGGQRRRPETIQRLLWRTMAYGGVLAAAIALVGGVIGWLAAGGAGAASALVGTALAAVFSLLTALSIIAGFRLSGGELLHPGFLGVVLGGLTLKLVLFLLLMISLQSQAWVHGGVLFGALVAAVLGTLVIDSVVIGRGRIPTIDEPAEPAPQRAAER